jgi:putative protease
MKKVELLAPAKDKKTAFAAINSGCDAVYIGASNFGARKKAPNSIEDIKEIVDYAHKFYVRVHVTINTILSDDELEDAQKLIKQLYDIGVDAIIVQDMGILKLAAEGKLPPIELHSSTQCDNRTLEKAKFFDKLGVSRIILARELSISQIKEICQNVKTEVETFVHGALCVSYSGQCYLSHYIGGRSANKGECAQACRKIYTLIDDKNNIIAKDKYLLSLRDFNASKHLSELINSGVKSFKIEGRLKDENYVKNVVAFYRKEIDKLAQKTSSGKVFLDFEPDVKKSFNRGFTDYFLDGRKRCFNFDTPKSIGEYLGKITKVSKNYFEINNKSIILNPQDGLYFAGCGCLVNKFENGKIYPNKLDGIKEGIDIYRNFDAKFEKQLTNSKAKRQIGVKFIYEKNILKAIDEDNNFVQIQITGEMANNPIKTKENFQNQLQKTGESDFYVQEVKINDELPFLPISQINNLRREILKKLMDERIKNYPKKYQKPLKYVDFPIKEQDYRANVHNNSAKEFYQNCNCKICEMSAESGSFAKELMRTKHCLKYAFDMCKSPKKLFLIDEKGEKYPLIFDCKKCEMAILNPEN